MISHIGLLASRRRMDALKSMHPAFQVTYLGFMSTIYLLILYLLICQIIGGHYINDKMKYDATALNWPAGNECEEQRWLDADFRAIHLEYSANIVDQIKNWNTDLLAEQPACHK